VFGRPGWVEQAGLRCCLVAYLDFFTQRTLDRKRKAIGSLYRKWKAIGSLKRKGKSNPVPATVKRIAGGQRRGLASSAAGQGSAAGVWSRRRGWPPVEESRTVSGGVAVIARSRAVADRLVEETRPASGPAAGLPARLGKEAMESSIGRRRLRSGGGGRIWWERVSEEERAVFGRGKWGWGCETPAGARDGGGGAECRGGHIARGSGLGSGSTRLGSGSIRLGGWASQA
jgi:hypothetical protein